MSVQEYEMAIPVSAKQRNGLLTNAPGTKTDDAILPS